MNPKNLWALRIHLRRNSLFRLRVTEVIFVSALFATISVGVEQHDPKASIVIAIFFTLYLVIMGYNWHSWFLWPVFAALFFLFWSNGAWMSQSKPVTQDSSDSDPAEEQAELERAFDQALTAANADERV